MSRIFSHTPLKKPGKNKFNLSHQVKFSCNMGRLVPILCEEVVPGDKFRGSTQILARMAPMLAPIMHSINVYTHFFFVPNRIVWNEWEDFITGGKNGDLEPNFPKITFNTSLDYSNFLGPGTLADYLGVGVSSPVFSGPGVPLQLSALPFRAFQTIYNEYYRDQNLSDPVDFPLDSVNVSPLSPVIDDNTVAGRLMSLRNRAWAKDYFTSDLPWAQRGAPVTIPITSGSAPIRYVDGNTNPANLVDISGAGSPAPANSTLGIGSSLSAVGDTTGIYANPTSTTARHQVAIDINGTNEVDFSEGDAGVLVNDFRRSIRLQEWLEKNARGGARYIEQIRSHFGVTSSDARLQRPEFLGGGKSPIMISEVLQTSESTATSPQANMSGHGISAHGSHTWSKFIEEHGYIIGIMSILPRTAYQQGVPRHFMKFDRFDFYWPEFANIGEQEVYMYEIYANTTGRDTLMNTFGYIPRYAEYKQRQDRVAGDFKTSLLHWHMGRVFTSPPALNEDFVMSNPTDRIFAVSGDADNSHKMWCLAHNVIHAVRPMPRFGVPTI